MRRLKITNALYKRKNTQPTNAFAFGSEDETVAPRLIKKAMKSYNSLSVKAGYYNGKAIDEKEAGDLAKKMLSASVTKESAIKPKYAGSGLLVLEPTYKHIILVDNLKPRKMRGVESRGMLLAADYKDESGKDCVELLTAPWAVPGTKVILEDEDIAFEKPEAIEADVFFQIEINVKDKNVMIGDKKLTVDGKVISTEFTVNGGVN